MIRKIAWKNIWFKPLNTTLSILLLSASVSIISVLILLQKQFEEQFSSSMNNIDLVLGAKGSPLQLVLSSVYQIDAPPGNISFDQAQQWMNNPFVDRAIPLAYGDNYRGYRIVGTNEDYLSHYGSKIAEGRVFTSDFEVVIGAEVAKTLQLKIGDQIIGNHGESEEGEKHEDHPYTIVGIAEPTGKVIDYLILSNISSVWHMHEHEHVHVHEDEDEDTHDLAHEHHNEDSHKEITAVLIKMKNKPAIMTWQRLIPQNTDMQAASPILEVNRLFSLFGIGLQALSYLAYGIMIISGISIFIALYNRLKERKYEFALLRINGATRIQLLYLVLIESLFLCVIGFILGIIFGRIALYILSFSTEQEFKIVFKPFEFIWEKEGLLLLLTLLIGCLAAIIPAVKAYRINISKTLANA